ncbi:alpha/beta hydrolase [Variovorax sp. PAMC 28711]|uniref:alpha/beta hydrolase n=1 Tax=Variovorax sp. PAMC 28711 TaxID=1795631 RepID=UPI001439FA56|nr:alpha/beta hydrolase fold domain-containing protein [Variovorax sp. PAMC 28711]
MNPLEARLVAGGGTVQRDIVYGDGQVGWSATGGPTTRPLAMDVYLPARHDDVARPALVMAFGGAFHRGSKENDSFGAEAGNTSVAEYCLRFALQGYVAFSIDYRLVPEDPAPGATPVIGSPDQIPTSRIDVVRRLMALDPATPDMLWRGIEAASDDMASAVQFVHDNATSWNVDPARIAIGGFSAGARTALNAALGENARVAAVVSLSGYVSPDDMARHLQTAPNGPAVLLVYGDEDLEYVRKGTPQMARAMCDAGRLCEVACVGGSGHFYRAEAAVRAVGDAGPASRRTVQQTFEDFLARHIGPGAPQAAQSGSTSPMSSP